MPPQNNETKPEPIKNAFLQHVKHGELTHPELKVVHPKTTYPPIPVLPYDDRAKYADPTLKNLLENATIRHLQPKIGTEISGIQLHELTDAQKDELALLTAHRGVVFFVDQKITLDQQLDLHRYYGPLHIHQNFGHPEGYPEVFVVEAAVEDAPRLLPLRLDGRLTTWHTDVSYERQPPSYTSLRLHTAPEVGADTLWSSSYEAYDRLTPAFQKFVEGLVAIHSSKSQAENGIKLGETLRRPWVEFEHPVVRTHPITKRKALFVNSGFTKRIKNLSIAESDAVLRFLFKHIAEGHEFQVRYHLAKDSVALWDNRIANHYATSDYLPGNRRGTRVTTQGEIPFFETSEQSA